MITKYLQKSSYQRKNATLHCAAMILGLLVLATVGCTQEADGGSTPQQRTTSTNGDPIHAKLDSLALAQLNSQSYGPGALCDKIVDPALANKTYGTATAGKGGNTRFPAIVANYSGTCISKMSGEREGISEWWVILSYDADVDKVRCLKVAGKAAIDEMTQDYSCGFKRQ